MDLFADYYVRAEQGGYACALTGKYCPPVSDHFKSWGGGIRYLAENKVGDIFLTCDAPGWLCTEILQCDIAKIHARNRQNVGK